MNEPTPLQRLLDEISPPASFTATAAGNYDWRTAPTRGDAGQAREILETLRARLSSADDVYPGIASALTRGSIDVLDGALADLAARLAYEQGRAGAAEQLATDRLDGARELYRMWANADCQANRVAPLVVTVEELKLYVAELEASIRRLSTNSTRVITGCRDRSHTLAFEEPF